jgi:RNA polymerase sigma factor (sigma-70 family)
MPTSSLSERLIGPLRRLAAGPTRPRSDGELLAAFVQQHDADAFESLVRRHGPMVFGVCRRVIHHTPTAEDAFQAVFVVLARRAASVVPREQVANFLFGVAYRTALKAKGHLARLRTREKQVVAMPEPTAPIGAPPVWDDVQSVIDEELAALTEKLRLPVVLCDLEGRPQREVAKHLGLPITTLTHRLAAARRKLAQRLSARGVTLSGGALAAVVTANAAQAVPSSLLSATAKVGLTAIGFGSGVVPANVLELSEGMVRMLALSKLKLVTAATLIALTLLTGAGVGLVKADDKQPAKAASPTIRPDLNDKEYLKRVCDSLRGSPATPAEIGYFVADKDPAKRKKVVTWLTEAPKADVVLFLNELTVAADSFTIMPDEVKRLEKPDVRLDLLLANPVQDRTARLQEKSVELVWEKTDGDIVLTAQPTPQPETAMWLAVTDRYIANAAVETDDAFLTRVIEAARGSKPTRLEKEYFTADKDAKKREKLLDLILSDPAAKKKLGPDWKKNMLAPPQTYTWAYFVTDGMAWADKLIDELLTAKKTDDQTLEALTLATTGRLPTDTEKKLAGAMVAKQKDKKAAWQEVATTLGGTDEAKKHAERLKPQANTLRTYGTTVLDVDVRPTKTKPVEPKK